MRDKPRVLGHLGNLHAVSEETQASVLACMGYRVNSPEDLDKALEDMENRPWLKLVPPVCVIKVNQKISVTVTLPEDMRARGLSWRFQIEGGASLDGNFSPLTSEPVEIRKAGGKNYYRYILGIDAQAPAGYHDFYISNEEGAEHRCRIIVTPPACYSHDALKGDRKIWGVSTQLYALKSKRNWGIGDFTDLKEFIEIWAGQGAAMVGVNPLHAMYPHKPERASPYGPSSRLFLNVMYIDVEAVQEFNESIDAQGAFFIARFPGEAPPAPGIRHARQCRSLPGEAFHAEGAVPAVQRGAFKCRDFACGTFREFQRAKGEKLFRHCLFEALSEKFIFEHPEMDGLGRLASGVPGPFLGRGEEIRGREPGEGRIFRVYAVAGARAVRCGGHALHGRWGSAWGFIRTLPSVVTITARTPG